MNHLSTEKEYTLYDSSNRKNVDKKKDGQLNDPLYARIRASFFLCTSLFALFSESK
jgi:hypothetical protein